MTTNRLEICLSDHPNPAAFVEDAKKRYPDQNVSLELAGDSMWVYFVEGVHPQIKCNIFSFLQERAQEDIILGGAR